VNTAVAPGRPRKSHWGQFSSPLSQAHPFSAMLIGDREDHFYTDTVASNDFSSLCMDGLLRLPWTRRTLGEISLSGRSGETAFVAGRLDRAPLAAERVEGTTSVVGDSGAAVFAGNTSSTALVVGGSDGTTFASGISGARTFSDGDFGGTKAV